jgi:DNA helicase IV
MRREGRFGSSPNQDRRSLYDVMRACDSEVEGHIEHPDLRAWLQDLESYEIASTRTRRLPFMAAIGNAAVGSTLPRFDHIVIDEGQDVRPLEWRLLLERLRTPDAVTILGDLNQRRSDFTFANWEELAESLGLDIGPEGLRVRTIVTSYRTTRQILEFANQLLDARDRKVAALREGPVPAVVKVRRDLVVPTAAEQAVKLARENPLGIVAVISMDPRSTGDAFRRRNWGRARIQHGWTSGGLTVVVLEPNLARGLEFDGVVVVEPADFPTNLGRNGLLYTSLTRAVRELTVVHAKGLPSGMRAPR